MEKRAHAALLADMRLALASEFGARAMYALLARNMRDAELSQVLAAFHQDECEQVERLRAVIRELGGRAPARSLRRALMSRLFYAATFLGARRLVLRSCYESECTVLRWYHGYAGYLDAVDRPAEARSCAALALTKARHARILEAWVAR